MKILYITFEPPSLKSGGGLGVKQSLLSLLEGNEITYLGPIFEENSLYKKISIVHHLKRTSNFLHRLNNFMFRGTANAYFYSWMKIIKQMEISKYDVIYVEFTRNSFVQKILSKKDVPIITRVHNIEYDYFKNYFKTKRNFYSLFNLLTIKRREALSINCSEKVIVLTKEDKKRLGRLYGDKNLKKIDVLPVCLEKPKIDEYKNHHKVLPKNYLLITGSLWYGSNLEGIEWFIKKVWNKLSHNKSINKNLKLVIAGSNPTKNLLALIYDKNDIILYKNPKSISYLFKSALIYIAPIFTGSGMKVKVAEALSHGLPIIGTDHVFIGYQIKDKMNSFIANNSKEFIEKILYYQNMESKRQIKLQKEVRNTFFKNYSIDVSKKIMKNILKKLFEVH